MACQTEEDTMDERFGREGFGRRYEDEERRYTEPAPSEYEGRRYRGEGYYGGYYQPSRSRGMYERPSHPDDRGFLNRAGDEVRSWFGDEEAEHRRREDEREARRHGWSSDRWSEGRDRGRWSDERPRGGADDIDERTWARQWGYVEDPYERGAAFGDRQRGWGASYGPGTRDDSWMGRGPYSGRGPKGYQRSDERIREDICDRLCEHGAIDASNVEVQVLGCEVTLLGFIPTRSQKRLAEDLVDSVSGVNEVHNQLRVSPSVPTSQPGVSGSQSAMPGSQPGQAASTDWRNRAA
jgi:osmotically-inducible protein OsmY